MVDISALITLSDDFHMWFTLGLIGVAIVMYASSRIAMETTSVFILSVLLIVFYIYPITNPAGVSLLTTEKLLLGFSNTALVTVIALLVVGQAVVQTGALNDVASGILRMSRNNMWLALFISLLVILAVSAFLNNTPVVVIFIPIIAALAKSANFSVSRIMMPISFAAILGGMITLIGSSTNLLVSGMLSDLGMDPLNFFDFSVPGTIIALVGLIYVLFIVPRILPDRASLTLNLTGEDNRQFVAQIEVDYTSDLIGKRLEEGKFPDYKDINVRMIQRGEHAFLPPFEENTAVRAGDIIVVGATRQELTKLLSEQPETLLQNLPDVVDEDGKVEKKEKQIDSVALAEIVVAPASRMIGRNLEQIAFHHTHDCVVLGIQRQSRIIRARVTEIRLAAGDVLLVMGKREKILSLQNDSDLLLLEWSTEDIHTSAQGVRAAAIFFSVVGLAAFDLVPIVISSLAGVAAVILTGCLNIRQAARAIDMQIIMLVATSLALGAAMQETGGATYLAHQLVESLHGASPQIVMSALFLLMMVITNLLSNNASAVLFTPIALGIATEMNVDPRMFIYGVIFACNCSFITPIGYQTNLLVMGPGHYQFSDFVRAGLPLALIIWGTYTALTIYMPQMFGL